VRFLVDECLGVRLADWLRDQGHEVLSIARSFASADDSDIVRKAFEENWIVVTKDKDFGEIVFRQRKPHRGIVLLRLEDERLPVKIEVLRRLLERHAGQLTDTFVVASETNVRIGRSHRGET